MLNEKLSGTPVKHFINDLDNLNLTKSQNKKPSIGNLNDLIIEKGI